MIIIDEKILASAPDVAGKEVAWDQLQEEFAAAGITISRWSSTAIEGQQKIMCIGDPEIEHHTGELGAIVQCIRNHVPFPEE